MVSTDYSGLTGGPNGLALEKYLPFLTDVAQSRAGFFIALAMVVITGVIILKILDSPFTLALAACRDAEHVATARGVNRRYYQLSALTLSGAIAGLAGGFYAHYVGVVAPTIISFTLVMNLFAMIIVGGIGTFWGPLLGTMIITIFTNYFQGVAPLFQSLIVSTLLLAMIIFVPNGLAGLPGQLRNSFGRRQVANS